MMPVLSHVNSDIAAQLNLKGTAKDLVVCILDDNTTVLSNSAVEYSLASSKSQIVRKVTAYTTKCVTGNITPVNWNHQLEPGQKQVDTPERGQLPKTRSMPTANCGHTDWSRLLELIMQICREKIMSGNDG